MDILTVLVSALLLATLGTVGLAVLVVGIFAVAAYFALRNQAETLKEFSSRISDNAQREFDRQERTRTFLNGVIDRVLERNLFHCVGPTETTDDTTTGSVKFGALSFAPPANPAPPITISDNPYRSEELI